MSTPVPFKVTSPDAEVTVFEATPGMTLPDSVIVAFWNFGEATGMGDISDISLDLVKFVTAGDVVIVVYAAWVPVTDRRVKGDDGSPVGQVQQLVTKRVTNAPVDVVATLLNRLAAVLAEVENPVVS